MAYYFVPSSDASHSAHCAHCTMGTNCYHTDICRRCNHCKNCSQCTYRCRVTDLQPMSYSTLSQQSRVVQPSVAQPSVVQLSVAQPSVVYPTVNSHCVTGSASYPMVLQPVYAASPIDQLFVSCGRVSNFGSYYTHH